MAAVTALRDSQEVQDSDVSADTPHKTELPAEGCVEEGGAMEGRPVDDARATTPEMDPNIVIVIHDDFDKESQVDSDVLTSESDNDSDNESQAKSDSTDTPETFHRDRNLRGKKRNPPDWKSSSWPSTRLKRTDRNYHGSRIPEVDLIENLPVTADDYLVLDMMGVLENPHLFHALMDSSEDGAADVADTVNYLRGPRDMYVECQICLTIKKLYLRMCCTAPFCDQCMNEYVSFTVKNGQIQIPCPSTKCDAFVHTDEILWRLDDENKDRFYRFLVNANIDPSKKTCPRCNDVTTLDDVKILRDRKVKKMGLTLTCESCALEWCFPCHAPWHAGLTCRQYRKGDKLLKTWARESQYGQPNAWPCPKCKVFIQRTTGCDHMVCNQCYTSFCYSCGDRFRRFKFIGSHNNRRSILGCRYNYYAEKPVKRRLIRGSIFAGKMLVAPVAGALALAAGAVLLGVGVFALPVWGGIKIRKKMQEKKRLKQYREEQLERRKALDELRNRGDPYLEHWQHMRLMGMNTWMLQGHVSSASSREDSSSSDVMTLAEVEAKIESLSLDPSAVSVSDAEQWTTEDAEPKDKVKDALECCHMQTDV